ncbi:esterase, putative [Ixodes scapularis]|uniref:Esterase, putative n=1 Tax=Ixodes scapularis TaxID=6945 RepID=B7QL28_IXOSC|nr:esterase, putative [Ixodes scapularis]|eukprot:XP_002415883.1 esterase, putative [Ixodes scapularis]
MKQYLVNVSPGEKQGLTKAYLDYLSDRVFNCPAQLFCEKHAARNNVVYSFVFAHRSRKDGYPSWMGAPHHTTVPYLFLRPFIDKNKFTEEDRTLSEIFVRMITSFAKNGTPVLPDGMPWPNFTKKTPISIVVESNRFTPVHGYHTERCESWRKIL